MFSTLKVNPETNSCNEVEEATAHLACQHCRSKKLKCTGEKNGCHRCLSRGLNCLFTVKRARRSHESGRPGGARSRRPATSSSASKHLAREKDKTNRASVQPRDGFRSTRSTSLARSSPVVENIDQRPSHEVIGQKTPMAEHLIDGNSNYLEDALYETDGNILRMEDGLGNDFWGELHSHTISAESSSSENVPTQSTGSNVVAGLQFQSDLLTSSPRTAYPSVMDICFQDSISLPLISPVKSPHAWAPQDSYRPDLGLNIAPAIGSHQVDSSLSSNGSCQCSMAALSLLEAARIQNISITERAIPRTLHLTKHALTRCIRLLGCEQCSACSSFIMLLIVISQDFITAYEQIIELLAQQFNRLRPSAYFSPPYTRGSGRILPSCQSPGQEEIVTITTRGHLDDEFGDVPVRTRLHEYEFDQEEEPAVFGIMVKLQLRRLQNYLSSIREILGFWNWDSHLILTEAVSARIDKQLALYGPCPLHPVESG
ncbi:hypothetical protein O988_02308 [Pseudogymnoascus sp. VKM F-3808]|nr:hypothetical protein O988_02308 [Pseudogymnoascus sp. VKM F-3808]